MSPHHHQSSIVLLLTVLCGLIQAAPRSLPEVTSESPPVDGTLQWSIVGGVIVAVVFLVILLAIICFTESCCSRGNSLVYGPSPFYYYGCCDYCCGRLEAIQSDTSVVAGSSVNDVKEV
ncbi:hypothetical protein QR680_006083 [Steinernema hermaphroditum]|uniref:Uncharacterized protein n=1 Tax=Steinernema hermaphroditum TaxID=289476 RepID=A0AA39HU83_9BILA|nr:hypothetical protein QR680_006083 [Steinernema hermaphroditum]